ncbi:DoxX family protein [Phormidium yuhuli AB48]|uniref:DoxX family protein n=1 Tax=Phormidium yuhuli AB48 TaxID=2940671 RepID=A0ABY5ALD8_9CYAN|nr:DoxX family protein [Phormidium yuhuli]USR90015.1 DoxX family protein [Phormidium yuhuli AB48]
MNYIPVVARFFLAAIFLRAGVSKIFGFDGVAAMMGNIGLPFPEVLLVGTIAFQILGSLSLILGYKTRIGVILLIIFIVPTSIIFHNPTDPTETTNFFKNLGLLGGLMMTLYSGAGPVSLDHRLGGYR